MNEAEAAYAHLIAGLDLDTSGHWTRWDWARVAPRTSYAHACLEEFRDSVVVAYRLYNLIGLAHARDLLADTPRDAAILDAGGGTGRKAIPLAQEGFTNITVLELAAEWLRLAREKAQAAGVVDRLTFREGTVLNLASVGDGSVDHVLALGGVVSYCGAPERALAELSRVLAPGGSLLADGIHGRLGTLRLLASWGNLDALERLARHEVPIGDGTPLLAPDELAALATEAGLEDVAVLSQFMFVPDDSLRLGPDTERWERVVLTLERRYCLDPRFQGVAGLALRARKPR